MTALAGLPLWPTAAPWSAAAVLSAAQSDASLDLVSVAADGTQSAHAVSVAAGTTVTVPLPAAAAGVWLRMRAGSVASAVVTSYADGSGRLQSVSPLIAPPLRTAPVAVYPLGG